MYTYQNSLIAQMKAYAKSAAASRARYSAGARGEECVWEIQRCITSGKLV